MKLKSQLLYDYMACDLSLRLFTHSSSSPKKKIHKGVVDYPTDRPLTHLELTINSVSTFCTQFQLFTLKEKFNFLHCLGLIDVLSVNKCAETFAY